MNVTLNIIQIYIVLLSLLFTFNVTLSEVESIIKFENEWSTKLLMLTMVYSVLFLAYNAHI